MQNPVTIETIRALARSNGLDIPEERLEIVLKDYAGFLELMKEVDSFPLDMTAEPITTLSLIPDNPGSDPVTR